MPSEERSSGRGGRRAGAGRPPKGAVAQMPHLKRPELPPGTVVHIIQRSEPTLPPLTRCKAELVAAIEAETERPGYVLSAYEIHDDRIELWAKVDSRAALRRALKGFGTRVAIAYNHAIQRKGRVFADRFQEKILS